MDIRALILSSLAAAGAGGCKTDCGDNSFQVTDASLTEAEVLELVDTLDLTDRSQLSCEDLCWFAHRLEDPGYDAVEFDTCESQLDAEPGATPFAQVGSVSCTGVTDIPCGEGEGRRPIGHCEVEITATDRLAHHFARSAYLEAASVVAFKQLADRLSAWGAPEALIARCNRAAHEETRHAALLGALAQRSGAQVPTPSQSLCSVDLACAALDNAVEGCVYEAWSALRAAWIAGHADSAELQSVYSEIAIDETGHAQLAWDLHRWFMSRASPSERDRIIAAQRDAIAGLPARARAHECPPVLGLPAEARLALARHFAHGLAEAA